MFILNAISYKKNNFLDKVLSVCSMKTATWYLFLFFFSINAAQSDSLKNKNVPSGLQLNAKGVLIQSNSSDEYFADTGSSVLPSSDPAKVSIPDTSNKSKDLRVSSTTGKQTPLLKQNSPNGMPSPELLKTKEMFQTLGEYHKLMGIYGAVTGALGIIAGAVLLGRPDDASFAISFITLGGISIGFGLWEIHVGGKLVKYPGSGK